MNYRSLYNLQKEIMGDPMPPDTGLRVNIAQVVRQMNWLIDAYGHAETIDEKNFLALCIARTQDRLDNLNHALALLEQV